MVGISSGGRTSKIYSLTDAYGRPVAFDLMPGNVADITTAVLLLKTVGPPKCLIADRAYDTDRLRRWLAQRRLTPAIPSTASQRTPYQLNQPAYYHRNQIERLFCRLKN